MQYVGLSLQADHAQATGRTPLLINLEGAEAIDVDQAIRRPPTLAQLIQGAYAQAGKGQHATWSQHTPGFAEHRIKMGTPLYREAGEEQLNAVSCKRQAFCITGYKVRGATQRTRVVEHALGNVQRHTLATGQTLAQYATEVARAAAHVQPTLWRQAVRQTAEQFMPDRTLQLGHTVVTGRRTGERGRNLALVRQAPWQGRVG